MSSANFPSFTDQVDPEELGYFVAVSDCIHLNPERAGMRDRVLATALPGAQEGWAGLRRQWGLGGESFRERRLRFVDGTTEKLRLREWVRRSVAETAHAPARER